MEGEPEVVVLPVLLVVCAPEELEEGSVGAAPGVPAHAVPSTVGIAYASSAPARRGTLLWPCVASVGQEEVAETSGSVVFQERGLAIAPTYGLMGV